MDDKVLADQARVQAVELSRLLMPTLPMPVDAIARLAARLLHAAMATVTLIGRSEEFIIGRHGLPASFVGTDRLPLEYSLCKYVVSADHVTGCGDMRASTDSHMRHHLLVRRHGIRAFLGVPVRDSQDLPVGALTVLDTKPRRWSDDDTATLLEIEQLLRPAAAAAPSSVAVAGLDSAALLDSVQQAVIAVNPGGTIVGFNSAAEQMLGYSRTEVYGRSLEQCLDPGYGPGPIDAALSRLFAAAPTRPVLREVDLRHRDGHRVHAEAALTVVRGAAGALACMCVADLSRQKAAERRAEDHGSFLSALLDSLSVGVVACDATGAIVVMNRALRDVYDLPRRGAASVDYPDAVKQALYDENHEPLAWEQTPLMRARRGETVRDADLIVALPGHRERVFAVTAQPIISAAGRRSGAVAVTHEVTAVRRVERFRACHAGVERALRSAASVAEAAPLVLEAVATTLGWPAAELFLIDELTGQLCAVGHWSVTGGEAEDFFDHTPVRGAGVTGRVWQTGRPVWVPNLANTSMLSTPFEKTRAEICLRHGIRTALAVPVTDGDALLGVLTCYAGAAEHHEDLLTVLLDGVAAQIGVFVALRRAEQLARQLARTQDDFITLVGHELRTPLTSLAAHVQMLADDGAADDTRQMIGTMARNTADLQTIVTRLLDLAGLDSGHLPLQVAPLELAGILREAVNAATAKATSSDVHFHLDAHSAATVTGDAGRLRQLLDDVLANAVQYSPHGGDVHISLHAEPETVELRVSDAGIGTPAQERDRVFDRFYRASNVRHHGNHGNGLGLSLARTIVELHGGTIRLLDRDPAGTTVVIRLPCTAQH